MAWEERNGSSYYYRKERGGGRVRSVYVGGDETARLIAQLDAMQSDEREEGRILARMEREQWQKQEAEVAAAYSIIETLSTGALLAAGFHTHKRQWRRTRG